MKDTLLNIFSMDVRSLAVVRVAAALIVLLDIVTRIPDIAMFYGDSGVLPTDLTKTFFAGEWAWSLHLLGGGSSFVVGALLALQFIAGLALLFGYKTRIATIVSWFLLVSLHNANPLILQGGDFLLRAVMFVGMFLPWGAVFSLDARRNPATNVRVLSGWTVAYLLQIGFLYFFASLFKHSPEWMQEGSAIYYALSIDQYATSFAHVLLQFPEALMFLTYAVFFFQHFALFLLFSPVYTTYIRTGTALALLFMHFSFAMSMHLGMFSWISMAALVGFIPSEAWDWFLPRVRRFVPERLYGSFSPADMARTLSFPKQTKRAMCISGLGILYIAYLFVWQASDVTGATVRVPHWDFPAQVLRIDQRWNLFAPSPFKNDGWPVVAATLENGEEVDLYRDGAPLTLEKPDDVFSLYPSTRWRKYMFELRLNANAMYRPQYAQYLCGSWNDTHEQKVETLDLMYMLDMTPAPGAEAEPVRPITLLSWRCADTDTFSVPSLVLGVEEVNAALLEERIGLVKDWLGANQRDDGSFPYGYSPDIDAYSTGNNLIRQLITVQGMYALADAYDDEDMRKAAQAAEKFVFDETYRTDDSRGFAYMEDWEDDVRLGASALGVLAMREGRGFESSLAPRERALGEFLLAMQREDGSFQTFLQDETTDANDRFYSGEALTAMARILQAGGGTRYEQALARSFTFYQAKLETDFMPQYAPWHIQAYSIAYDETGKREYADYVFILADQLIETMINQDYTARPIDAGRFYNPDHPEWGPPHSSSAGIYTEGIAYAYELAERLGDEERMRRYRDAVLLGTRSLLQMQWTEEGARNIAHPERVIGGLRVSTTDNRFRIDQLGHAANALVKVREALFTR